MSSKKQIVGKVIVEFGSIVFAVLLALGLSHWRETKAEQEMAEQALANITIEIYANMNELSDDIPLFKKRIESIENSIKLLKDTNSPENISMKFSLSLLNSSAWKASFATGVAKEYDMNILMELSDIYDFQKLYQDNAINFFNEMNTVEFHKEENITASLSANLGYLKNAEKWCIQLHSLYHSFLKKNEDHLSPLLPDSIQLDTL